MPTDDVTNSVPLAQHRVCTPLLTRYIRISCFIMVWKFHGHFLPLNEISRPSPVSGAGNESEGKHRLLVTEANMSVGE